MKPPFGMSFKQRSPHPLNKEHIARLCTEDLQSSSCALADYNLSVFCSQKPYLLIFMENKSIWTQSLETNHLRDHNIKRDGRVLLLWMCSPFLCLKDLLWTCLPFLCLKDLQAAAQPILCHSIPAAVVAFAPGITLNNTAKTSEIAVINKIVI